MHKLISLLSLPFLVACSSSGPSTPPAADQTPAEATSTAESTTPALTIQELLATMPNEPLPPAPESLTRAQRDGQSVVAKRSAPTETTPAPRAEAETAAAPPPAERKASLVDTAAVTRPADRVAAVSASPTGATPLATSSTLSVESASVAKKVVDRKPSGQGPFADGGTVWTWNRIINPGGKKRTVRHIYSRDGKEVVVVSLTIGGASWRTWSHTRLQGAGQWQVDIVDEQGVVLKSLPFLVK